MSRKEEIMEPALVKDSKEHIVLQEILLGTASSTDEILSLFAEAERTIERLEASGLVFLANEGTRVTVLLTLKGISLLAELNGQLPALAE